MKSIKAISLFGAVGTQDQINKGGFFFFQLFLLFCFAQIGIDADIVLALILAQVEDFKSPIILAFGFESRCTPIIRLRVVWIANLPRSCNPFTPQLFCHGGCCARATKKVGD